MCGIVGALSFKGSAFAITEPYLVRMRDVMTHRGPDGAGVWVSDDHRVGLGHRRLAIIDLSPKAGQPMTNEDGSVIVVFNGEIYNHADIRRELEAAGGHVWKTDHSDTEVILHAFEQWGIDCLHRFRGMFAIALWDSLRRELWLVRDRMGVKPLYYSLHSGRITFASEIKALLEDPGQKRAVHEEAFFHYLSFLATPAPQTLFDGIHKLPNGCLLKVTAEGKIESRRWWEVWDHVTPLPHISLDEASERVLSVVEEAVRLRGVSDVPVGVFLSGGVDSSTNAALFAKGRNARIKTFSIAYDGDYDSCPSELPFARQIADQIGSEHHELKLTVDDLVDFVPHMIELQDEPIADPVCVPVYFVSKLARDNGVIVAQVGEGADELFCGYRGWEIALMRQKMADRLPVPRFLKRLGLSLLEAGGRQRAPYYEWLRRSAQGTPQFWSGAESFYEVGKHDVLSPRLKRQFAGRTSWETIRPLRERFEAKAWERSPLAWMSFVDLHFRLPELLLMRVDKMSMGVSLEGRVPFLDHKLVELALSLPANLRYRQGEPKRVLKTAVRGVIPDSIIDRKKQGFGAPVAEWFKDRLGGEMNRTLRAFCSDTDFFDGAEVERLIAEGSGVQLWFLYNFAMWHRRFIG